MNWFKTVAPIRLKLSVSYGLLTCLTGMVAITGMLTAGPNAIFIAVAVICTLGAAALSLVFREAIAGPYAATVIRMEALAANDLTSPIDFTDYHDCVGRMTKAMYTFKDAAAAQFTLNADACQRRSDSRPAGRSKSRPLLMRA